MPTLSPTIHQFNIPTPFPVGDVNAYLLEGERLTLVDGGPNTDEALQALKDGLARPGYSLADIEQVIITHHHSDHMGLAAQVVAASGAQLLANEYAVPFLKAPRETRRHFDRFFQRVCEAGAVPLEMQQIIAGVSDYIERYVNAPIDADRVLCEGDMVFAGGREWRVLHTPGHAGDLICLYDVPDGILLASDHIIGEISSNPLIEPPPGDDPTQPRPRRLHEYLYHMQRVADLQPQIAYSGHGAPVHDVPRLVAERVKFHGRRAEKILAYFDDGPAHLWDITERMYGHLHPRQKFLAISEVLGHIDLLELDGRLHRRTENGVVYWFQHH
jgi:glyoxylase-like metal-dependent hydrolase (beta-lactamase superfamily II)